MPFALFSDFTIIPSQNLSCIIGKAMLSFFYFSLFLLIFWSYAGYILFLTLLAKRKKPVKKKPAAALPTVTMIIPCFNEEKLIKSKIKNLQAINYPPSKLDFVFVDGGSTDRTTEIVKNVGSQNSRMKLVKTTLRNKIRQINQILPKIKTEFVVISDVDTKLDAEAIKNMIRQLNANDKVAVVGAYTRPQKTISLETTYWQKQNQLRLLESKAVSSSIVVANCYGFKNGLLEKFPNNVVADDIYLAFWAQSKGLKVAYSSKVLAFELRAPQDLEDFIRHKFRKAHAYIKEVLRFFPKLNLGGWEWKLIYLTKFIQVILGPPIILIFLFLASCSLSKNFLLPGVTFSALFLGLLVASRTLNQITKEIKLTENIGLTVAFFISTNLILFFALLLYPFYKQTASYKKLGKEVS